MKEIEQKDIKRYIENERLRMLDELFAILRIPSVSAVSAHSGDMRKMAEMLVGKFLACGADKACVMETGGHPAVFAEKAIDPAKPDRAGVRPLRRAARRTARTVGNAAV